MQGHYPAVFEREMACTTGELLAWLPGAARGHAVAVLGDAAVVTLPGGCLRLSWQVLPPRRIGLLTLDRLAVQFRFDGVTDESRQAFMRYFDLYTQRGGG